MADLKCCRAVVLLPALHLYAHSHSHTVKITDFVLYTRTHVAAASNSVLLSVIIGVSTMRAAKSGNVGKNLRCLASQSLQLLNSTAPARKFD